MSFTVQGRLARNQSSIYAAHILKGSLKQLINAIVWVRTIVECELCVYQVFYIN